jgi:hypothetical protein
MPVSGKCRNANRMIPPSWRSTCSIARNACREYRVTGGKISEEWAADDIATIMTRIGAFNPLWPA